MLDHTTFTASAYTLHTWEWDYFTTVLAGGMIIKISGVLHLNKKLQKTSVNTIILIEFFINLIMSWQFIR